MSLPLFPHLPDESLTHVLAAMVELMQKGKASALSTSACAESISDIVILSDSSMACFAAFGDQTAAQLRDRFQPSLTHSLIGEYIDRLIDSSLNSNWTRLYDSVRGSLEPTPVNPI